MKKHTASLLIITLMLAIASSAQDLIPDTNLNQAVRLALRLAPEDTLTSGVLLNLNAIQVTASICDDDGCRVSQPVSDLTGLEHAENLESIYLRGGGGQGHDITDLSPIAGLTQLKTLRLPNALKGNEEQKSAATKIIGEFKDLTRLSLEDSAIDERHLSDISGLSELEVLDLDSNAIDDLTPISGLRKVYELDVDKNPLTSLAALRGFQRLQDLDASPGSADLNTLPALRSLRRFDAVTQGDLAPLARCPNISTLSLFGNFRDLTPLANLPYLQRIDYRSENSRRFNGVVDLSPLAFTQATFAVASIINGSQADVLSPENASVIANAGLMEGEYLIPAPYDNRESVPDGRLRQLPRSPGVIFASGLLDLKGIGEFDIDALTATHGWITTLQPLLENPNIDQLDLRNNYISDVSGLESLSFLRLNLMGNPLDHDTIPQSWRNNPNVIFDTYPDLEITQTVPDPALREAIRNSMGVSKATAIDADLLADLVWLYAENQFIRELTGLEQATNLRGASLRNNIIKDISAMTALESLQWLRLSGNPISQSDHPDITTLRGSNVRVDTNEAGRFLSSITPVDGIVYASGYQLTSVRYLQLFDSLTELFLSDNYLTDLSDILHLQNLARVHIDGNYLYLSDGAPDQIDVQALQSRGAEVTSLPQQAASLAENLIEDENLQQLIAIDLGEPFTSPAYSTEQLESVTEIDWALFLKNQNVPVRNVSDLEKMVNLEALSLERAGLSDISFVSGLTQLKQLDLDYNRISDVSPLSALTNLVELDLNNNQIKSIAPLSHLSMLEDLDIDSNQIRDVSPLASLEKLRVLDIQKNQIQDFSPLLETNLELLNLQLNGLTLSDPAVSPIITRLASKVDIGNPRPQLRPTVNVSLNRPDQKLVLKWTPLEGGVSMFVEDLGDLSQRNNVSSVSGVMGKEIRIEIQLDGSEHYYRVSPVGTEHF